MSDQLALDLGLPQYSRPIHFSIKQKQLLLRLIKLIASYDSSIDDRVGADLVLTFFKLYPIPKIFDQQALRSELEAPVSSSEVKVFTNTESVEEILLQFDCSLTASQQRKTGSYYTPQALADFIIKGALQQLPANLLPTSLDPACGSGIFLVRLIEIEYQKYHPAPEDFIDWINTRIFAVDINYGALIFTWLGVIAKLWELLAGNSSTLDLGQIRAACPQLLLGNFLLSGAHRPVSTDSTTVQSLQLISKDSDQLLANQSFDLIVGNPPYGLSRAEQIKPLENGLLKKSYAQFLSGKPNKFLLFLIRAYELLGNRGVLSFVTPNSWLGVKSAKALRSHLLLDNALYTVSHFDNQPFGYLGLETIVTIIGKESRAQNIQIDKYSSCQELELQNSFNISSQFCLGALGSRVPLIWTDEAMQTLNQIYSVTQPLIEFSDYFYAAIALQAYAVGKGNPVQSAELVEQHKFHSKRKLNNTFLPYLEGKDISRYCLSWSGNYLSYGPWLAEPQKLERFQGPRIVLREILGKYPYLILAQYTEDTFLYNKSCLHILPGEKGTTTLLKALLAILNSSLAGFIIRHTGYKSQRSMFPKLVADDLRGFPLPRNFSNSHIDLAKLVESILNLPLSAELDRQSLIKKIDLEVRKLYGLDSSTFKVESC